MDRTLLLGGAVPEESLLYAVVAEELETFLAAERERGHDIPGFVEREFRAFLDSPSQGPRPPPPA